MSKGFGATGIAVRRAQHLEGPWARSGRSIVPGFANPLRGWKDVYEFIELCRQYVPGSPDLPIETQGLSCVRMLIFRKAELTQLERGMSMRR